MIRMPDYMKAKQKQINSENIYISKKPASQEISSLTSDDMPSYQNHSFCHYLKIKNFTPEFLFPNKKITSKQSKAICSIVANCMRNPGVNVPISLHKSYFCKGSPAHSTGYTFDPFNKARHMLEEANFIEVYAPRSFNTNIHPTSLIRGLPNLNQIINRILPKDELIYNRQPNHVMVIKAKGKNKYILPSPKYPKAIKIKKIMLPYHEILKQHDISCNVPDEVLQLIKSNHTLLGKQGEAQGLPDITEKFPIAVFSTNLNSGGRLYYNFWTSTKKEYRPFTRIDGEQLVELDFKSMHPNILYKLKGITPPNNIYIFEKSTKAQVSDRDISKLLLLASINISEGRTKKESRLHTVNAVITSIKKKTGIRLKYENVLKILLELEVLHKPIVEYFYTGAWEICTMFESNLIREIIKTCTDKGKIILTVHDSVICKVKDIDIISEIIQSKTSLNFEANLFK